MLIVSVPCCPGAHEYEEEEKKEDEDEKCLFILVLSG